jgi:hypothetical protein
MHSRMRGSRPAVEEEEEEENQKKAAAPEELDDYKSIMIMIMQH